ncbi:hypothetical protein A2U01_0068257, partial [Trifolium medium]|nr:hypothetical protein [Trifolium medium]
MWMNVRTFSVGHISHPTFINDLRRHRFPGTRYSNFDGKENENKLEVMPAEAGEGEFHLRRDRFLAKKTYKSSPVTETEDDGTVG